MNIKECHVILDQSQCRISYVHLCKNTKVLKQVYSLKAADTAVQSSVSVKLGLKFNPLASFCVSTYPFI